MIDAVDELHGVAISFLLLTLGKNKSYSTNIISCKNTSEYILTVINSAEKSFLNIALYIKSSQKRRSPWAYTFTKKHQEDIDNNYKISDNLYVIFVNSNDGIIALNYKEFRKILDYNHEDAEGIRVVRKYKQSYRLSGRDGLLKYTVPPSKYPKNIKDFIIEKINK